MGGSTKRGNKVGRGGGRSRGQSGFIKTGPAGGKQVGKGEDGHRGQSGSRKMAGRRQARWEREKTAIGARVVPERWGRREANKVGEGGGEEKG